MAPPPLPSRRLHGLGGDIRRLPVQGVARQTETTVCQKRGPHDRAQPSPAHMTRRHDPVRLCDGQPADDDDIPATDIDALRDARAEATLCPVCQQNSHIHDYSLRPDRYQDGSWTLRKIQEK